jgi:tetratricopeptide (TPR) repeat protein
MIRQRILILFLNFTFIYCSFSQDFIEKGVPDREDKVLSLIELAKEYRNSNLDSAIYFLKNAQIIASKNNLTSLEADALKELGVCYYFLGDFDQAKSNYKLSMKFLESDTTIDSYKRIGALYNNLGLIHKFSANIDSAIVCYKESEKFYKKAGDNYNLARLSYSNLGGLYLDNGNYPYASEYFLKGKRIWEEIGDSGYLANSYDQLAVIAEIQEDFKLALELYTTALKLREETNDSYGISYSYNNLGIIYMHMEEFGLAKKYLEKSEALKLELGDEPGIASTQTNLGIIANNQGFYEQGLQHHLNALEYSNKLQRSKDIATSLINIGYSYLQLNEPKKALNVLEEGLQIAEENQYTDLETSAHQNLSSVYKLLNECEKELVHYQLFKELEDSLMNKQTLRTIARIEMQYVYENEKEELEKQQKEKVLRDSLLNSERINKIINEKKIDSINDASEKKQLINERQQEEYEKTVTVIAVISGFIGLLLVLFFIFRSYRMKQKNRHNEIERKAAEIEKSLLQAQMNPHFIFNAMNSIQGFISNNDNEEAERYLAKFAKLIRLILQNSTEKTVSLLDEMEALKFYLELEKVRFDKKFDFHVSVDENIDEEFVYIPPMLIQPYVENAILHGIMHKKDKGNIWINLTKSSQTIVCEIIDDGIGRQASAAKKQKGKHGHKSIGMHVTKERLQLLNEESNKNVVVDISDVIKNDEICGTKVTIRIPFEEE